MPPPSSMGRTSISTEASSSANLCNHHRHTTKPSQLPCKKNSNDPHQWHPPSEDKSLHHITAGNPRGRGTDGRRGRHDRLPSDQSIRLCKRRGTPARIGGRQKTELPAKYGGSSAQGPPLERHRHPPARHSQPLLNRTRRGRKTSL